MIRYPRHPVRYRRTLALRPFPHDGTPIQSWRELPDGSLECVLKDGRRHTYAPGRFSFQLTPYGQ